MTLSTKLFGVRYTLKVFFPPERRIKWLPAILYAQAGPAIGIKERNT
jgi:hypothetical protein